MARAGALTGAQIYIGINIDDLPLVVGSLVTGIECKPGIELRSETP